MKKSILLMGATLGVLSASLFGCGGELSNDTLVVGMEVDYAPFNWAESSANEYTLPVSNASNTWADGYDIQIVKRLSEITGKDVTIVRSAWSSLIPDLQNNVVNVVIAGMTDTEERRESIDFTDEYYRSELVLVTSSTYANQYDGQTLDVDTLTELLSGQLVVSQSNTVTDEVIDILEEQCGARHATPLSSFALCATDVSNGSAFAMTAELPVAQSIVGSFDNLGIIYVDQDILGELYYELGVSIGVKKGNTELVDELNEALVQITQEEREEIMAAAVLRSSSLEETE